MNITGRPGIDKLSTGGGGGGWIASTCKKVVPLDTHILEQIYFLKVKNPKLQIFSIETWHSLELGQAQDCAEG